MNRKATGIRLQVSGGSGDSLLCEGRVLKSPYLKPERGET
jgi:hypothetical protein